MRINRIFLLTMLLFGIITGCAEVPEVQSISTGTRKMQEMPQTVSGTARTHSSEILQQIWNRHTEGERFLVFGGYPEKFVPYGPGDLEINEMLENRFFLEPELRNSVVEGAAMEHLLSRGVFCSAVFRLAEGTDPEAFACRLCDVLEKADWQAGIPQRLLITQPEAQFVLVAVGQADILDTFLIRTQQAFPQGRPLYYQEIPRNRIR